MGLTVATRQAETTLETTTVKLKQFEMISPFAGVATKPDVEITAPRQVLMVLATVDGLPDVELSGHVTKVDRQAVDYQGDVTYPVTVELAEGVPGLRWGKTAVVEVGT